MIDDAAERGLRDARRQVAVLRALADDQRETAARFAELCGPDPAATAMAERAVRAAGGLDQIAALEATRALAYADLLDAGGPDDSRAWVEYEATLRRIGTLYPGPETFG